MQNIDLCWRRAELALKKLATNVGKRRKLEPVIGALPLTTELRD